MNADEVDSFTQMFLGPPGDDQRAARQTRAKKERKTQMTAKQLKRGAVRTTQINFRCSPEFVKLVKALASHGDCSIADVLENAAQLLADNTPGFKGV